MCAKNKVWKRYKNVSGGNFSEFWEDLEDSEKDEWQNEKKRRKYSSKSTRDRDSEEDEVSGSEDQ